MHTRIERQINLIRADNRANLIVMFSYTFHAHTHTSDGLVIHSYCTVKSGATTGTNKVEKIRKIAFLKAIT